MSSDDAKSSLNNDLAYVSLAQMSSVCKHFHKDDPDLFKSLIFRRLLQNGSCMNYQIPADSPAKRYRPDILGNTALHFAASRKNLSVASYLLDMGADVTMKNHNGLTPLHLSIETSFVKGRRIFDLRGTVENPLADVLLDAQVKSQNFANPKSKNGISHFHIACMLNHEEAVEFFVKSGACVNERVSSDSATLPGYTALHFAARYCSSAVISTLLQHQRVDKHSKDAEGMTPLYVLLDYKMRIQGSVDQRELSTTYQQLEQDLFKINRAIKLFTPSDQYPSALLDDKGFTCLHLMCTDTEVAVDESYSESIRNFSAVVDFDSPVCPGYTPAHFAAHFNNYSLIFLLNHGADAGAKAKNGLTPLDIFVDSHTVDDLHTLFLFQNNFANIRMSSGDKLVSVIHAMRDEASCRKYLQKIPDPNMYITIVSPIWPRCNLAHIAVMMIDRYENDAIFHEVDHSSKRECNVPRRNSDAWEVARLCFEAGVDFNFQDLAGTTPLHYAFRRQKRMDIPGKFWPASSDPVDIDDLSHSHIIACTAGTPSPKIEKFFQTSDFSLQVKSNIRSETENGKVYVRAGSTHLHMAVLNGSEDMTKLLLRLGADPTIKNDDDLTPIHLSFFVCPSLTEALFSCSEAFEENSVAAYDGLSHLHVACATSNTRAIEAYLKLGADVNLPISSTLCYSRYAAHPLDFEIGFTPLYFAVKSASIEAVKLLIRYGARVDVKSKTGLTPLLLALKLYIDGSGASVGKAAESRLIVNYLFTLLRQKDRLGFEDELGVTLLHWECVSLNEEAVMRLIGANSDLNARIGNESPVSPGCTALHVLMSVDYYDADELRFALRIAKILLLFGADVNIANADGKTPIHVCYDSRQEINEKLLTLLQYQRMSSVNPADNEGLTHFHLACRANQRDVVEQYLANGVDVNHATDTFRPIDAGYSALHFAMKYRCERVIDVLLRHGADVNAIDPDGYTPLLTAFRFVNDEDVTHIEALMSRIGSADINASRSYLGESPLEILYASDYHAKGGLKATELALSLGLRVNVYNPNTGEGVLGILLKRATPCDTVFRVILEKATDLFDVDQRTRRSAIHNVVSVQTEYDEEIDVAYDYAIRSLLKRRLLIDCQDYQGKTALHVAVEYANLAAVKTLLTYGADVNATDYQGLTPYYYSWYALDKQLCPLFQSHVSRLLSVGLKVNYLNKSVLTCSTTDQADSLLELGAGETRLCDVCEVYETYELCEIEISVVNCLASMRSKRAANGEIFEDTSKRQKLDDVVLLDESNFLDDTDFRSSAHHG